MANLISVTIPKNIEIQFRLEDDLPLIRGGSAQIRQVLMNLITNAADAIDNAKDYRNRHGPGRDPGADE